MQISSYEELSAIFDSPVDALSRTPQRSPAFIIKRMSARSHDLHTKLHRDMRLKVVRYQGMASLSQFLEALKSAILSGRHIAIELLTPPNAEVRSIISSLISERCLKTTCSAVSVQAMNLAPHQRVSIIATHEILSAITDRAFSRKLTRFTI